MKEHYAELNIWRAGKKPVKLEYMIKVCFNEMFYWPPDGVLCPHFIFEMVAYGGGFKKCEWRKYKW